MVHGAMVYAANVNSSLDYFELKKIRKHFLKEILDKISTEKDPIKLNSLYTEYYRLLKIQSEIIQKHKPVVYDLNKFRS